MEILRAIIYTLNQIEVHGKENLDRLLGSIQELEKLDASLRAKSKKEEKTNG